MTRRDHGDGGIDSRGEGRHRLRWRVDGVRYSKTFKGSITDARRELRRLLKSADEDAFVEPRKQALGQYLIEWLDNATNLSPKSVERYRQLIRHQIIPHLGTVPLQKLRSDQIERWHFQLTKSGLHPRTVTNTHGLLTRALERAVRHRIIVRNEARGEKPPKVPHEEVEILTAAQIAEVLAGIEGHPLHPIASLALASGMRRGELCALKWSAVDVDKRTVKVEYTLEETAAGLRLKAPKTKAGTRIIKLPPSTIEMLRAHYRQQIELRLQLGLGGRPGPQDWVFMRLDGGPFPPDQLSATWLKALRARKLPAIRFHALRHTHASALIAAGLDIVSVSKRLGHSTPNITLSVYSHLFARTDDAAADAIERALGSNLGPKA